MTDTDPPSPARPRLPWQARAQLATSKFIGWWADRRVPVVLRDPLYCSYARLTGADLGEMAGEPRDHATLGRFFVRSLREGARTVDPDPERLPSPVDGLVQARSRVERGTIVEAKGRSYDLDELHAGAFRDVAFEGGWSWTLYLGPKDYHRIHAPLDGRLVEARHVVGARHSVQPRVLAKRRVLPINERVVLRFETEAGPLAMVLVGALIVGRIRVAGVERFSDFPLAEPIEFARGDEVGRFEMGSTVVMTVPPDTWTPLAAPAEGGTVRLGEPLARRSRGES